jgi:hypothetical protein
MDTSLPLDGRASAPQALAIARRRISVREEGREHIRLAKLLAYYIDPENSFWTSLENRPMSLLSGLIQKKRGCRSGLPDVAVFQRRGGRIHLVFIELKSRRGEVSPVQKQVCEELRRIGARWWCVRSARAGVEALRLSGVGFRRKWEPPRLQYWEGPFSNPMRRLPVPPEVIEERRIAARLQRQRYQARVAAARSREADGAAAVHAAPSDEAGP